MKDVNKIIFFSYPTQIFATYEKGNLVYSNALTLAFGQANLADKGWRKTDDRLYYMSKLSYKKSDKLILSTKIIKTG